MATNITLKIILCLTISFSISANPLITNSVQDATKDSTNLISNIFGAFSNKDSLNITQFLSSFDMPSCFRRCMPDFGSLNHIFSTKKSDKAAMKSLCSNLMNSTKCATTAGCSQVFVDAMNNAFQFMCIEDIDQVSKHFACIQEVSGDLQQDCEQECSVQANILENASKNKADELLNLNNMCNSTTCLVKCYRDNLVDRCQIGETNLLDSIFSQVLNGEKNGFEQIMGFIIPNGCNLKDLSLKIPKKIKVAGKPKNVGKSVAKPVAAPMEAEILNDAQLTPQLLKESAEENSTSPVETTLLIDGEVRTLQCQMLDWQKNPIQTPDFESLARLMSAQLIPFTFPKNKENKKVEKKTKKEIEPEWRGRPADQVIDMKSGKSHAILTAFSQIFLLLSLILL